MHRSPRIRQGKKQTVVPLQVGAVEEAGVVVVEEEVDGVVVVGEDAAEEVVGDEDGVSERKARDSEERKYPHAN